ncbi:hypothetical protein E2562_028784 [Oryza meyeriana var. granulata]|uniref:DUF4283 domain-containing protein n=1 Tax=Oryza meyeriana var. granulata TaxID=110450 RepID=A0A6G1EC02_9ORYZ|nr:hypothetical protein E2562_028784 [Oryza meyeriana var. granulata]
MEEELRHTLTVVVVGNSSVISVEVVKTEIARGFHLDPNALVLCRAMSDGFLLMLPDEATAELVYNGGRPLLATSFRLFFRRWSRFANSTGTVLSSLIDVELRGIPAHAWDLATAQQLLDENCWIRELHSDTASRRDYSSFRLTAWCSHPERIPPAMDLLIVEPPMGAEEVPAVKRALSYPVDISVAIRPSMGDGSIPPSLADGDGERRRRRRRRRRGPSSQEAVGDVLQGAGAPRIPVHARLGPAPISSRHVADTPGTRTVDEAPLTSLGHSAVPSSNGMAFTQAPQAATALSSPTDGATPTPSEKHVEIFPCTGLSFEADTEVQGPIITEGPIQFSSSTISVDPVEEPGLPGPLFAGTVDEPSPVAHLDGGPVAIDRVEPIVDADVHSPALAVAPQLDATGEEGLIDGNEVRWPPSPAPVVASQPLCSATFYAVELHSSTSAGAAGLLTRSRSPSAPSGLGTSPTHPGTSGVLASCPMIVYFRQSSRVGVGSPPASRSPCHAHEHFINRIS